jgi:hypothetical protein
MDRLLKLLLGVEAVIFILAAAAHLGLPVPWLVGPRVAPAAVAEGVGGLAILYASLHGGARTAYLCQVIGFGAVVLALAAISLSGAPHYVITDLGQIILLAALGPGLVLADRLSRAD